jgi:hypothetical protein
MAARKKKRKFTAKQLAAQRLFAKRAKAGTLKKKKRKTTKKNAKRKAPAKRRATAARRKPARPSRAAKRTTRKRNPSSRTRFVIRALMPKKDGYDYYYYTGGDRLDTDKSKAALYPSKSVAEQAMRLLKPHLPPKFKSMHAVLFTNV